MPLPGQMESIYFKHCFDISYPAQSYRNVKKKLGSDDLRTQYFEACWLIRAQTSVSQSERAFYSVHCIMNNSRKERGLWKHTRFENKFESRIRTQSRARCLMWRSVAVKATNEHFVESKPLFSRQFYLVRMNNGNICWSQNYLYAVLGDRFQRDFVFLLILGCFSLSISFLLSFFSLSLDFLTPIRA